MITPANNVTITLTDSQWELILNACQTGDPLPATIDAINSLSVALTVQLAHQTVAEHVDHVQHAMQQDLPNLGEKHAPAGDVPNQLP